MDVGWVRGFFSLEEQPGQRATELDMKRCASWPVPSCYDNLELSDEYQLWLVDGRGASMDQYRSVLG